MSPMKTSSRSVLHAICPPKPKNMPGSQLGRLVVANAVLPRRTLRPPRLVCGAPVFAWLYSAPSIGVSASTGGKKHCCHDCLCRASDRFGDNDKFLRWMDTSGFP